MTISPLGDSAVVIALGETIDSSVAARVRAVAAEIERHPPAGLIDVVPAFATLAVYFDPLHAPAWETISAELAASVQRADAAVVSVDPRTVIIPVCYGGEFGPDLAGVAAHTRLPADEVVAQHAGGDYLVHAIGFSPGFPYLGGLPAQLETPRRATPRRLVPAGSVGIGGVQTGIYPSATPGGWNIIGRTPAELFDAARREPALLRAGDRVKFRAVPPEEFAALRENAGVQAATGAAPRAVVPPAARIEVLRAGMFTTVQDLGRPGWRAMGVPLSGAADPFALRVANALVGNAESAAGLEFTLVGPELRFTRDAVVALTGAAFADLPRWRPCNVAAGTVLKLGVARDGCRGFLAIAGGIDVPAMLGSRSTYVRAQLGGKEGRALRDGDVLPVTATTREIGNHWRIDERILPGYSRTPVVRVVRGRHAGEFGEGWLGAEFKTSSRSDRMGVRLEGGSLTRPAAADLVSLPVAPGTVQVPPDGQPIILLADAQTIGGYPQIAHVVSVDLPLVAQLRPGDRVRFQAVALRDAVELLVAQERALALLREGLAEKLGLK